MLLGFLVFFLAVGGIGIWLSGRRWEKAEENPRFILGAGILSLIIAIGFVYMVTIDNVSGYAGSQIHLEAEHLYETVTEVPSDGGKVIVLWDRGPIGHPPINGAIRVIKTKEFPSGHKYVLVANGDHGNEFLTTIEPEQPQKK